MKSYLQEEQPTAEVCGPAPEDVKTTDIKNGGWATIGGGDNYYFAVGETYINLPPGVYACAQTQQGFAFQKTTDFKVDNLITFNDSEIKSVIEDIRKFWTLEDHFKNFNLAFKRGILLYGPPGGGKSSVIKLAIKDVIDNGGIGIVFNDAYLFERCMLQFRKIQPNTPVVVIMEDIDALLDDQSESIVLNLLDGVGEFSKICFIATTNYPEELEGRISNRPSRFDRRYHIGSPNKSTRKQYIEFLFSNTDKKYDIDRWTSDTKDMSIAHIKELFISVHLYQNDYNESINTLKEMNKKYRLEMTSQKGKSDLQMEQELINNYKIFKYRHDFISEDLNLLKQKYNNISFNNIPEAWIIILDDFLQIHADKVIEVSQHFGFLSIIYCQHTYLETNLLQDILKDQRRTEKRLEKIDLDLFIMEEKETLCHGKLN